MPTRACWMCGITEKEARADDVALLHDKWQGGYICPRCLEKSEEQNAEEKT